MSLRIVSCNILPGIYNVIASWAEAHGHQIILLVTSPIGTAARYGVSYLDLAAAAPPSQDILITDKMRKTLTPVVAALQPDLLISATFPHRLPAKLTAIPRYGAINIHPAPLPEWRGPNPLRPIYDGELIAGITLHRTAPEFDTGEIYSQQQRMLTLDSTGAEISRMWGEMVRAVLEEGVPRAIAGEPGEAQDESRAGYAAAFTPEERWISWEWPVDLVRRRVLALSIPVPRAHGWLGAEAVNITAVQAAPGPVPDVLPGTILAREGDRATIRVGDGAVIISFAPAAPERISV